MLPQKSLTPHVLKVEKNRDGKTGVISRGDRGEAIYQDDEARRLFLRFLGEVCERWKSGEDLRDDAALILTA